MLARILKKISLLSLSIFSCLLVFAQDKVVTGTVTDSKDGNPISGVSVLAKGTRNGTSTDEQGNFKLSVPASVNSLLLSFVGYTNITVDITGKTNVSITMSADAGGLSEVVVTGYGSSKRKDLTGSIASVKEKDFNKGVFSTPDQLIQGKVAGMQIINNSGQPGVGATIRIRGASSVRSGNGPLFVVDGVPLDGGSGRPGLGLAAVGTSPAGNPLAFLNPADIESMDVLKDASAAAIYGSRGSNGVIIVTTKKAKGGSPQIEFGYSVGAAKILKQLEVLDGNEYRAALTKYGLTGGDYGSNINAMDEILRTGVTNNLFVSATGGSDNSRYRFSASALGENGIVKESGLTKYTVGFTGNFKFLDSKKFGLDVTLNTAQVNEDVVPITNDAGAQGNLIAQALQWNPTHDLIKADGTYWVEPQFGNSSVNPLWFLKMYEDKVNTSTIYGSISPYYKFTKELEYRFLYSINQSDGSRKAMVGRGLSNFVEFKDRGIAAVASNRVRTEQYTHTLSYNKQITSDFNLNAVVGYEYMKFYWKGNFISAQDFVDIGIPYYNMLGYATQSSRNVGNFESPTNELQSYFGRAAVNFKGKYFLTATVRTDGSTKFGENNKYGTFPSFSAAWNVSNESFMSDIDFVNNLKLRVGWGQTGNQEFPSGASQTRFGVSGPGSITQLNVGNPNLKWETSSTFNVGLDFALLKNKVNVTVDYFNKETDDVLFEVDFPVPGASSAKQWQNFPAYINNKGIEVTINTTIIEKGDFYWSFGANGAWLKNQIDGLNGTYNTGQIHGQGSTNAYAQKLASGYPLNVYYLRHFEGIDKTTGQGIYTEDGDVSYYGESPNPSMLLGISTNVEYKKFSLAINMNGAFGHYLYNNTATSVVPITNLGTRNVVKSLINSPIKEDLSNPITSSDRYLEKGNYLKMTNATLSYDIGSFAKFIKRATLSLTGQNLFVLTDFTGFDPEVNVDKNIGGIPSNGMEYIPYPTARKFLFSIRFGL